MPDTTITEETEYLTVKECLKICRLKAPETIRRAVQRGELPGVKMGPSKLLIPAKAFWVWFHKKDVKPRLLKEVELPTGIIYVRATDKRQADLRVKSKAKEKVA